jgi:hypothetical protein
LSRSLRDREQASGWQLRYCLVARDTMLMLPCAVLTALHNSSIAKQDDLPITVLPLDVDHDDSVVKAVQHLLASYAIPYLACRHVG